MHVTYCIVLHKKIYVLPSKSSHSTTKGSAMTKEMLTLPRNYFWPLLNLCIPLTLGDNSLT